MTVYIFSSPGMSFRWFNAVESLVRGSLDILLVGKCWNSDVIILCASTEWLLDGLAVYLTDSFIKKHLGNNEARYQRFKVCAYLTSVSNMYIFRGSNFVSHRKVL